MKLAIILCGQIRTFNLTKWILQNIKNKYNCDIFMGIDPNNLQQNEYLNNKNTTEKEIIDTAKELGQQLKAFGKEVTTPKGGKGFDSGEIEVFSDLLIQLKDAIKNGNASSLLGRIKNLLR